MWTERLIVTPLCPSAQKRFIIRAIKHRTNPGNGLVHIWVNVIFMSDLVDDEGAAIYSNTGSIFKPNVRKHT